MTKVKICGLFRDEDINYVNETLPNYAGFIIDFEKSHRSIDYEKAKKLISQLDTNIKSVCVFVNKPIDYILKFKGICDIVQLHGNEDNDYIAELKKQMPNTEIWQAFKITNAESLKKAKSSNADMILLDNGYGTGNTFDWTLIDNFDRDFILAGGINATNLEFAIDKFMPFALDISSGAESDKLKNFDKIAKIINITRRINDAR